MRTTIVALLAAAAALASENYHGVAVAPDGMNSWVVTNETTLVFHSTDLGGTWQEQTITTIRDFFDVFFLDDLKGWTCGRVGDIWHTENGGDSWFRQNLGGPKFATKIRFIDENVGWAAGGEAILLHTTDGGSEWQMTFFPNPPFPSDTVDFYGVYFHHPDTGWLVAGRFPSGDTFARGQGFIARTVNGGTDWALNRRDTVYDFFDVAFLDGLRGWVVGGDDRTMAAVVLQTTNGGEDWNEAVLPPGAQYLRALEFVGPRHGWACGRGGTVVHTSDGGTSWQLQPTPADTTLFDVDFADTLRGMIAGNSVVYFTTDGGNSWLRALGAVSDETDGGVPQQGGPRPVENPARAVARFALDGVVGDCVLAVHDIAGRVVRELHGSGGAGALVEWDGLDRSGRGVPSGVYLVRVAPGGPDQAVRFVFIAEAD